MGTEPQRLHVVFFPLMAAGHMIPTLDIAKLFAAHHVKTTIVTTPLNAPTFLKPLQSYTNIGPPIDVQVIPFPAKEAGLPEGVENFEHFTSDEMSLKFLKAAELLEEPLIQVLERCKPKADCLVADMLLPFATEVAAKFDIPRLVFHGSCCFALSVMDAFIKYQPHKDVSNDDEEFVIPHLPHEIKITRMQLNEGVKQNKQDSMWMDVLGRALESEIKSYGVIVNSFYELEAEYADFYRKVMGRKMWQIGPVSLCNRENEAKFQRGKDSSIDENACLKWLDSKKPNSVIYVCFGSLTEVSLLQLHEIAKGLQASEQDFIWVIRRSNTNGEETEDIFPKGFEERTKGKGLIIKGWAPQVLILDHEAVGGFVTHCGWNSTLEGISCGVPMVTWPAFAEQFYIEKLVTEILKTGIPVGSKHWNRTIECNVKWEDIKEVVRRLMIEEEGVKIRSRALKLKNMARKAIDEGGSSYVELTSLIQELSNYKLKSNGF
uniref:Glycosyltransferase n=1 Tax=Dianthus caryophyllus TaxID=3570 RepID=A0A5S9MM01_DIACA|nr:chalcononaringenin 2'-O-glucosyltransferase [Dianthus caryophyllus]